MPIIRVEMWEGKTKNQKRDIVKSLSNELSRITGSPLDSIYVLIEEVSKDDWGVSGELCSEKFPD